MANTKKKTSSSTKTSSAKKATATKTTAAKKTAATKTTKKVVEPKKEEKVVKGTSKVVEKKDTNKTPVKKTTTKKVEPKKETKEVVKKEKKNFKLTSKQKDIVLIILAAVLLIIATVLTKEPKLNIELPIELPGEVGYQEISFEEYNKKVEAKEPFVVVIVRDGCHYCEEYNPVVEKVSNDLGLSINYINLTHLSNEDANKLISTNKYFRKNQQWGTPTTLFMYGEDIVDSLGGYVDEEGFTNFAKENFKVK